MQLALTFGLSATLKRITHLKATNAFLEKNERENLKIVIKKCKEKRHVSKCREKAVVIFLKEPF